MAFDWPTHMDYDGQYRSERWSHIIVVFFGVVGWIIGYINQLFSHTVLILGVGVLLAALVTLPPWPMYRRKPLNWRKPREDAQVDVGRKEKEPSTAVAKPKKKK